MICPNQAASEGDRAKRAEIYKKIQQIFIERGPVLIRSSAAACGAPAPSSRALVPTGYLGTAVDLTRVYFEK